jgi:hypothetical protein
MVMVTVADRLQVAEQTLQWTTPNRPLNSTIQRLTMLLVSNQSRNPRGLNGVQIEKRSLPWEKWSMCWLQSNSRFRGPKGPSSYRTEHFLDECMAEIGHGHGGRAAEWLLITGISGTLCAYGCR